MKKEQHIILKELELQILELDKFAHYEKVFSQLKDDNPNNYLRGMCSAYGDCNREASRIKRRMLECITELIAT